MISGAGPAGAAASLYLSDLGIKHLVLEKAAFPRDKICGDAVSGKMLNVLARLKPEEVKAFAARPAEALLTAGMQFVAPSGRSVDIPFPPAKTDLPVGVISRRLAFDQFLASLLHSPRAEFRQQAQVTDARYVAGGVELTVEQQGQQQHIVTPLVIAADGSRSVVKKKLLGDDMDERHYCGGIRAYYQGVQGLHPENYLELHFYKDLLPGYFWIFPLPGGYANVGLGMLTEHISKRKVNLRQELLRLVHEHPRLKDRFASANLEGKISGWGLPLGSRKRPLSAPHLLLTGDAGSLIDPFTGEGIGNAGISGMVAARVAAKAVAAGTYTREVLQEYDHTLYQKLWRELQLSHTLQRLSTQPWLFSLVVNRISASPTLRNVFTNMFYDLELRAQMKNPWFYVKLLAGR